MMFLLTACGGIFAGMGNCDDVSVRLTQDIEDGEYEISPVTYFNELKDYIQHAGGTVEFSGDDVVIRYDQNGTPVEVRYTIVERHEDVQTYE